MDQEVNQAKEATEAKEVKKAEKAKADRSELSAKDVDSVVGGGTAHPKLP
jgi:predicted ATP-dependent serine protease